MGAAIGVSGKVAPGLGERCANRPAIGHRIVDIHLVGGVREGRIVATWDPQLVTEVKAPGIVRGSGYVGNRGDRIGGGIISK